MLLKDKTLRMAERVTATNMVGRILPNEIEVSPHSILVFAAHPDDDVLGVGITMHRYVREGNRVRVIFTSNGGGHNRSRRYLSKDAQTRYAEACVALSQVGIPRKDVACLGFPDGRLYRYMTDIAHDIKLLVQQVRPKRVYVHSIEGGHRDHDVTGFVVQSVCKKIGYFQVYEWTEYNSLQTLKDDPVDFPAYSQEAPYESVRLFFTPEERALKQSMLLAHPSQASQGLIDYHGLSELVRPCKLDNLTSKLHYFWGYSISTDRLSSLTSDFEMFLNKL